MHTNGAETFTYKSCQALHVYIHAYSYKDHAAFSTKNVPASVIKGVMLGN